MKQFNVNIRYESSNKISYKRAINFLLRAIQEKRRRKKKRISHHKYEKEIKGSKFRSSSETGVNSFQTIRSAEKLS